MLTIDDLKNYAPKMLRVVQTAKQIQSAGPHYLWGAQADGHMLPDRPGPPDSNTFMRCAALHLGNINDGVCAGRPEAADVKSKPKWDRQNAKAPGAQFRWPRYFKDTSTDGSPKVKEGLVWGEDCTGKKHFDCAGFVRYCFRQVLGSAIPTTNMHGSCDTIWPSTDPSAPNSIGSVDIWPADLLFDDSLTHVGIASGSWLLSGYGVTEPGQAIHCYSATVGVITTPITDPRWVNWRHVLRWPKWD
jgi:hypothetical protein